MISPRGVIFCPIFCSGVISTSPFEYILLFNKGIDLNQIPPPSSISSYGDNFELLRFYGGEGFEKQKNFRNAPWPSSTCIRSHWPVRPLIKLTIRRLCLCSSRQRNLPWTPHGHRQLAFGVPLASQTPNQVDDQKRSESSAYLLHISMSSDKVTKTNL